MALIWALVAFLFTVTVIVVLSLVVESRTSNAGDRLRKLTAAPKPDTSVRSTSSTRRSDLMPTLTHYLGGRPLTERLYIELSSAGLPVRPSEFAGILLGSVILFQVLGLIFLKGILGFLFGGIIGVTLPVSVLRILQQRRRAAFNNQIVDALLLMASSLRSGFSFQRAMQMVSHEMPPPISQEFGRVLSEMNVGRPMEDALRGAVARVRSYDLDLIFTAVIIQHQVGGNLAEILETIAATIRERVRVIGEMQSLTAEGRFSGIILVLLPLVLAAILFSMNPDYMSVLVSEPMGRMLIGIAVILQILGGLIIKKMLVLDI